MNSTQKKELERAESQARAQFESIKEMVDALAKAEDADDQNAREDAEQTIHEDPLSVEVRSGWTQPGAEMEAQDFMILLCTGGPACRIIGELNQYNEPDKARIEYQDWFTPWTEYPLDSDDTEILLRYCRCFYFE